MVVPAVPTGISALPDETTAMVVVALVMLGLVAMLVDAQEAAADAKEAHEPVVIRMQPTEQVSCHSMQVSPCFTGFMHDAVMALFVMLGLVAMLVDAHEAAEDGRRVAAIDEREAAI